MNNELIKAVYTQLNCENKKDFISTCKDIANHGANSGFNGFIYTQDTNEFCDKYQDLIDGLVDDSGLTYRHLSEDVNSMDIFKNNLTWFALESVASYVTDTDSEWSVE